MVSSHFKLTSTATAIAIVAPEHLRPEINSLRKLHDKAYRKWEPHINLLYPFVDPSQLAAATSILRQHLLNNQTERLRVDLNHVDVFTHRRNATVFLKPGFESEEAICQLRASLAIALGCDDSEGTHDGKFRPHMTIGQAGLTGLQLERLSEKVGKLTGVTWEGRSLVVLKRQPTGEMSMVEELPFGILDNGEASNESLGANHDGYKDCFSFSRHMGWTTGTNLDKPTTDACQMTVATYNLMSEPSATPFLSRLPLIIDSIKSSTASSHALVRVLCLQEVDEEMLPLLLADPFIHENYPHSSHSPSSLLLSHRNLVTMSSEPFRYTIIDFDERHKCMLDICLLRLPIRVVNVHLSSSLTNEAVRVKQNQMEKVTKFTTTSEATDHRDVIVAGDFNLTTSSRTIQTALSGRIISLETAQLIGKVIDPSIWVDAFMTCSNDDLTEEEIAEGEEGATFDRSTNPLAAMSEPPIDRSPQRYDRVLFRRGGHVEAQQVERFGFPTDFGDCGSDHYGVCATLRLGKPEALDTSHSSTEQTKLIDVIEDVYAVLPLIQPYLPSQEDRRQREEALGLLHQTLSRDGSMEDLILAPLGSYLMDTYFSDSDVDVLAIASVAPKVFFEHASAQLQELSAHGDDENDFKGVHFVNSLVSIIELTARGIKFDLQYCQAPELVDKYHRAKTTPNLTTFVFENNLISSLSPSSIRPLNTYRDTAYLLNTISDLPSYRVAHRFLSLYLKRRGLYSAKFGYLGGIHLSLMLNRVVKLIPIATNDKISTSTIIRTFFAYYSTFDWAKDVLTDPELDINPTRSAREAVFIHAIHTPTARPNVASSCTRLSAQTFSAEFSLAATKLEEGNWAWCLRPKDEVVTEFSNAFGAFVRIAIDVWDIDEMGGERVREIVGGLESKLTRLLVGLGRLSHIEARVWPARLRTPPISCNEKEETDENQLKGYYLVGISAHEDDTERKKLLTSKIISTVREFETSVKEAKEFQGEGANVWLSMDLFPKKKVLEMNLVLDERNWGAGSGKVQLPPPRTSEPEAHVSSATLKAPSHPQIHRRKSSNSLRPAQDIISRIKWDPILNIDDFLIGYEDRFIGVKEVELGKWKTEQTDEEFIPMHRIIWVRRKGEDADSDGEKVWDRRKKIDLLFGSGVGSG